MDSQKSQSMKWDERLGIMIVGIGLFQLLCLAILSLPVYLLLKFAELPTMIHEFIFKLNVNRLADKKDVEGLIKALRYKDWRYNSINNSVTRKAAAALKLLADERAIEPSNQYEIQCQAEQDAAEALWYKSRPMHL